MDAPGAGHATGHSATTGHETGATTGHSTTTGHGQGGTR